MNKQILKAIEKLAESVENLREDTNQRFETLTRETNQRIETLTRETNQCIETLTRETNQRIETLTSEVSWIRGKLEGRDESKRENRVNLALGTACVSAVLALAALIKGCF